SRIEPSSSPSVSKSMGPWAKESGSAPHAAAPRPTAEAPDAASRERRDSIDAVLSVRTRLLVGAGARPSRQCGGLIRRRPRTVTACQGRCKSHAAGPGVEPRPAAPRRADELLVACVTSAPYAP